MLYWAMPVAVGVHGTGVHGVAQYEGEPVNEAGTPVRVRHTTKASGSQKSCKWLYLLCAALNGAAGEGGCLPQSRRCQQRPKQAGVSTTAQQL